MKGLHLDEIREGPAGGARWLPARFELGLRAFGASAYQAGADPDLGDWAREQLAGEPLREP